MSQEQPQPQTVLTRLNNELIVAMTTTARTVLRLQIETAEEQLAEDTTAREALEQRVAGVVTAAEQVIDSYNKHGNTGRVGPAVHALYVALDAALAAYQQEQG